MLQKKVLRPFLIFDSSCPKQKIRVREYASIDPYESMFLYHEITVQIRIKELLQYPNGWKCITDARK